MISKRLSRIRRSLGTARERDGRYQQSSWMEKHLYLPSSLECAGENILKANLGSRAEFEKTTPAPQRPLPSAAPSAPAACRQTPAPPRPVTHLIYTTKTD